MNTIDDERMLIWHQPFPGRKVKIDFPVSATSVFVACLVAPGEPRDVWP